MIILFKQFEWNYENLMSSLTHAFQSGLTPVDRIETRLQET